MSSGHRSAPAPRTKIPAGLMRATRKLVEACTVIRRYDVETLANRSRNGRRVYVDESVPVILPKCGINTNKTLPWHELSEKNLMDKGVPYDKNNKSAHPIATAVEKIRVELQKPGDPDIFKKYTEEMNGLIEAIKKKKITNPPPDQDQRVLGPNRKRS